jgi:hypothetical protein
VTATYRLIGLLLALTMGFTLVPAPAQADSDVLLRLLQILRDRGSITEQEYEELKAAAEASDRAAPAAPVAAAPEAGAAQERAVSAAARAAQPEAAAPPERWYQRYDFRGYAQLRFSETAGGTGPALEVPTDRSVNEDETFIIRRGRLVLTGEVSDHLELYAQADVFASTGAATVSLQLRDLYADINLDPRKAFRVRVGQSKVPFGWVNMQSSQHRVALERPDAINSAVEGERDLGAFLMWAPPEVRARFDAISDKGLKGSGDYGVAALGVYSGQGLNRSDRNGEVHVLGRLSYPFQHPSGQLFELGVQGYRGKFVSGVEAIVPSEGAPFTPDQPVDGVLDRRVGITAVWYPQPLGVEVEWNVGDGPSLSEDFTTIEKGSLNGGYAQVSYLYRNGIGRWMPFARWHYFDGARKFADNAPRVHVEELDIGLEFARWAELELSMMYTRTFERTRSGLFPYEATQDANRVGFQVQWNY